jgi:beta-lactamase regulating signal transducer with metallopeptidase domain
LVSLWLAGIVFLLGRVAAAERRMRVRLRHAHSVTDARVLGVWSECLGAADGGTRPAIAEVQGIPSPVLLGVIRPRVLLPEGLAARLTDQELRHIFVHELVHYGRRDILVNWLGALLNIVHWFNPLVWWSARRLAEAQELACDAAALGRLRTEEPAAYGHTLVRVLELTRFEDPRIPSVAGIMRSGSLTRTRIQMIHLFKGPARWSIAGGGAVVVALAIVAMTFNAWEAAAPRVTTLPPLKSLAAGQVKHAWVSGSGSAPTPAQPIDLTAAQIDYVTGWLELPFSHKWKLDNQSRGAYGL